MSQPGVKPRENEVLPTIRTLKVCNKKARNKIECDGTAHRLWRVAAQIMCLRYKPSKRIVTAQPLCENALGVQYQ